MPGTHRGAEVTRKSPNLFAPQYQSIANITQDTSLVQLANGVQSQTFITGPGISGGPSTDVLEPGKGTNLNTYRTDHPNKNILNKDFSGAIVPEGHQSYLTKGSGVTNSLTPA